MPTPQQPLSPVPFFNLFSAYQRSAVMNTALELELFSLIGQQKSATAADIAKSAQASERGIRILCDYLTACELLKKNGDSYSLTPETAFFLDQKSPAYIGSGMKFLYSPDIRRGFDSLTDSVRNGGTVMKNDGAIAPDHPQWVEFAKSMAPLMYPGAQGIAEQMKDRLPKGAKVLDIAAGHGLFGIAIAQKVPTAQITALDWKNVLAVAEQNAQRFGVADRHHKLIGDAFSVDYGSGYDAVLVTNLLHHFDAKANTDLLRKVYTALKPGG